MKKWILFTVLLVSHQQPIAGAGSSQEKASTPAPAKKKSVMKTAIVFPSVIIS